MKTAIVEFNGKGLITAKNENTGDVFVAMKPFVESMGLSWGEQLKKLNRNERYSVMTTPFETNGGVQEMLALNIKHLPAYLGSINTNKVREDLRPAIIAFQDECFIAINNYWNNGIAVNPRMEIPTDPIQAQMMMIRAQMNAFDEMYALQLQQAQKINTIESKVNEIIEAKEIAQAEMLALPKPDKKAKECTVRKNVSKIVNVHCQEMHKLQQEAYTDLYREFRYRYGIDVNARMEKGKFKTKLDCIESLGMMEELYALAYEMFGMESVA